MGGLTEVLGFLIVFGLLAALVGTLATGVVRIIGFGVLVALALIIGTPTFRAQVANVPVLNRIFPSRSNNEAIQSAPSTTFPTDPRYNGTTGGTGVPPTGTTSGGVPPTGTTSGGIPPTGTYQPSQNRPPTTGTGTGQGVPARW
ncbi:hypothetical protein ACQ4M4_00260 [Leptolyngbya sp. AN02str]